MFFRLLLATGAALAAAVVATPLASADSAQDQQFIDTLSNQGITFPSSDSAISDAHAVCSMFSDGQSFDQVAQKVVDANPGLSEYNDGFFIGASVKVYCPQYSDELPQ
ncbi:DUF732 domain-containing protein [Skermania sp. ID1734]|uniref:DUF732 domain-containing protein n=1 Tax=Skermania sp. ID1734 TaxID=2597516 RepID=UPI00117C50E5|nr:DUF732 domain-containing protein [Skermania sp. ID1734]TSE00098.1 DUF732 domain-containing protein [Skermania sp. ID1734]